MFTCKLFYGILSIFILAIIIVMYNIGALIVLLLLQELKEAIYTLLTSRFDFQAYNFISVNFVKCSILNLGFWMQPEWPCLTWKQN